MTEAFLKLIFDASVTAGIAAAAVMLIRVPLKKAPKRWSYLLWAVVFFRCLCPFSVESTVSLFNAVPDRSVTAEQDGNGTVNAEVPQTEQQEIVSEGVQYDTPLPSAGTFYNPYGDYGEPRYADYSGYANFEENYGTVSTAENIPKADSTEAAATADNAESEQEKSVSIHTILLIVWLAGVTAMAVYGTVSYARLMIKIRTAVKTEDGVYETDMIPTAFSAGFFPPRVYIPCGLSDTERRLIVTHERVHIRRFDYITKPLAFTALAVHWFNPLIWAAFALMTKDMELSCDEAVLKICGAEEKKDYSRALLRVSMKRSGLAVIPLAFAETGIKGRVKNVLGYKKPKVLATVLAAALVFGSCAVLGTNAKRGADDTKYIELAEGTTEFSGKNGERIFFSFGAPKASGTGGRYYECAFELDGETVQMPYLFWNDKAVNGNLAVHSIISDGTSLSYDDKEFNIGTLVMDSIKIDELFVEDDGDTTYMNVKLRVSADDDFDNAELVERLKSFFEMNQKDGFEFNIEEAEASEGEYAFDVRADLGEVVGGETVGYSIMLLGFDDISVYASENLNIVGHAGGGDVKSADRVLLERGTTEFIDENGERILFAYGDNEVAIYNGKKETVLEPHLRYRDADGEIRSQFISEGMTLGFKGLEAMSSSGGGIDSIGGGIDIDCGISEITINDIRVNMNDYYYCAAVSLDILADDTLPEKMKCLTWTESCADIDISGGDGRYTVNAEITARLAESGAAEFYALVLLGFDDVPIYAAENLNIVGHIDGGDADAENERRVLLEKGTTEFEDVNGESVYFAYGDTVTYTSMGDTVETVTVPAFRYRSEDSLVYSWQVRSELKGLQSVNFTANKSGSNFGSSGGVDIDCDISEITITDIHINYRDNTYYTAVKLYILADDTLPEKIGCSTWIADSSSVNVSGGSGRYIVDAEIKAEWVYKEDEHRQHGVILLGFDDIPVYAAKELKIVGHTDGGSEPKFPIVTEQPADTENREQFSEFLNDIKSSYPQPLLPVSDEDIGEYGASSSHVLFSVPKDTEVLASADGTVKSAEISFNKGYGKCIEISHVGGMSTFYAHLDDFAVEVGDAVKAGDVIGYSGSSGNTVGGALLFEIRMDGKAQNPWNYFYFSDDGYKRAQDEISKDYVSGGVAGIYNADGTPVVENEQETIEIKGVLYYLISTEEQLRAIAVGEYGMDKNFLQNGDIQLSDKEWLPIGTKEMPFTGSYNGNGYEISGLTMKDPDAVRVGMFGYAENAHIYNITLRDYDIESAGSNAKQISVAPILPVVTNGTRCYDNNV